MAGEGVHRQWPLVGRDEELRLIADGASRGPVVIAGEPGVGKSRLVSDWLMALGDQHIAVVATRAAASVPFGAFAPWVPPGLDAERNRLGVLRAVADELARLGGTVVVDDAHLLDDASAALVLHLTHHRDGRIVLTVRSETPCPDAITAIWKDGIGIRIDLRPLSRRECDALLRHRLGGRVHSATEQRLWKLSTGNPMYLREVTEAALERGQLAASEEGVWSLTGPLTESPRLVDLVEARLGRLRAPDRSALELVALGEPVPLLVLTDLLPSPQVARLVANGLLMVTPRHDTEVVRLAHPLYSEVLRNAVPRLTARQYQHSLAAAVMARGVGRDDPLRVALWLRDGAGFAADADLLLAASRRAMALQDYALSGQLAAAAVEAGGGAPGVDGVRDRRSRPGPGHRPLLGPAGATGRG